MAGDLPTGTVTFVFTDIEGSGSLWQEQAEAMGAALPRHDEIMHRAITTHRGRVVKTTGDGVHGVFAAADDAMDAAVTAQRAIVSESWPTTPPLRVRIGIHSGPSELRDGDYYGTTVNRAARLMSVAHGGQIVCSQATAELIRDDRTRTVELVDLGEHRLRDLARPIRVYQLAADGLPAAFPTLRSLDHAPTNLPVLPTALVGRRELIVELADCIEREPLVTMTGVGGVGKTRLAYEVAAELLPRFPDGVWVVELAPLAHDEMVLATIADVLGIAAQTGEPLATTLVSRLRARRLLLVIDNCEHVLNPVARFADRLLASAPHVRIMTTSREPLGISAELVRAVPPLSEDTEAVELFLERAEHAGATIVGPEQQQAIREICARLDGIPLAVELAAARARMMAPTQIAERLDRRFRLLTGGGRTAVERHRTLLAAVSWSYELLDEAEQAVFQRLSTTAGSFDLAAAEAIASGGVVEDLDVLDALGHLVDKSMVLAEVGPRGVRYRVLETLRQFSADRLAEQPDAGDVHDRHAAYYLQRAAVLLRSIVGSSQASAYDEIDADLDNYRNAIAHLLSGGRADAAARGLVAMAGYWQTRRPREGLRWQQQALAHPELNPRVRLQVLSFVALAMVSSTGDVPAAERFANEAVELAETIGTTVPWSALLALLTVATERNDVAAHHWWYDRCVQCCVAAGDDYLRLITASMRRYFDSDGDAREHFEKLTLEVQHHGDPLLRSSTALGWGLVSYAAGRIEDARGASRLAMDPLAGPAVHYWALATAAAFDILGSDDLTTPPPLLALALRGCRDEGMTGQSVKLFKIIAAHAARAGATDVAATLLDGAERHGEQLGRSHERVSADCASLARRLLAESGADLASARRLAESLTVDDLIELARRWCESDPAVEPL
jgi:predicted ATPase/class 3 adenylate cyclase